MLGPIREFDNRFVHEFCLYFAKQIGRLTNLWKFRNMGERSHWFTEFLLKSKRYCLRFKWKISFKSRSLWLDFINEVLFGIKRRNNRQDASYSTCLWLRVLGKLIQVGDNPTYWSMLSNSNGSSSYVFGRCSWRTSWYR